MTFFQFSNKKDVRLRLSYYTQQVFDVLNVTVIGSNLNCGTEDMYVGAQLKNTGFTCSPNTHSLYSECTLRSVGTVNGRRRCDYSCICDNNVPCDIDILLWLHGKEEFCEFKVYL